MRSALVIILLISHNRLTAQQDPVHDKMPRYSIQLTTMNGNMLKGLMLETRDSSVKIYPGNRKEWKAGIRYNPVVFDCVHIQEVILKRKNNSLRGMLIGAGIGMSAIAISFLASKGNSKAGGYQYTIPILPLGILAGMVLGGWSAKKYYINGSRPLFTEFKKRVK